MLTEPESTDLFDAAYTVDETLKLAGYDITVLKGADGEVKRKGVVWKYGEDLSNPDFRLLLRVFRGDTVENVISAEQEYEQKTVGDLTYTVLKTDENEAAYEYYVQHGNDVYEVRNSGRFNGMFTNRSEESVQAFEALLNSVHFE